MSKSTWLCITILVMSWIMVNAAWGITGSGTMISEWIRAIVELPYFFAIGAIVLILLYFYCRKTKNRPVAGLTLMVSAYTLGVLASEWMRQELHPDNAILDRLFVVLPAVLMIFVRQQFYANSNFPLRFGDWTQRSQFATIGPYSWFVWFLGGVIFFSLPTWVLFQLGTGFEAVQSGRLWTSLPTILGLSILNGFTEELLFRGLLMIPLIHVLGLHKGILFQALYFGFHHWGSSPEMISGLVMVVILTMLGVLLGKSVIETRGLGWATIFHATLDVAILSVKL